MRFFLKLYGVVAVVGESLGSEPTGVNPSVIVWHEFFHWIADSTVT